METQVQPPTMLPLSLFWILQHVVKWIFFKGKLAWKHSNNWQVKHQGTMNGSKINFSWMDFLLQKEKLTLIFSRKNHGVPNHFLLIHKRRTQSRFNDPSKFYLIKSFGSAVSNYVFPSSPWRWSQTKAEADLAGLILFTWRIFIPFISQNIPAKRKNISGSRRINHKSLQSIWLKRF